uniref:Uncharacterized protein n=1 Tax=Haemonchus contortus TaxID=6289 RepID=A0A7I5ED24_HAECO
MEDKVEKIAMRVEKLRGTHIRSFNSILRCIHTEYYTTADVIRNGQTDRQADRQTGRQTDRQTDRQIGKQTDRQIDRQTDRRRTYGQIDGQTDARTDRRQTDRQTSSQTDREADRLGPVLYIIVRKLVLHHRKLLKFLTTSGKDLTPLNSFRSNPQMHVDQSRIIDRQ